jgi:hypothetical protein
MDPFKRQQKRERRAKVKAEWAAYDNTPERKEQKRQSDILIKKDRKSRRDYVNQQLYYKNIKKVMSNHPAIL